MVSTHREQYDEALGGYQQAEIEALTQQKRLHQIEEELSLS